MTLTPQLQSLWFKGPTRILLSLIALILTIVPITQAQVDSTVKSNFNYGPSPTTAMRYSLFSTLLPVTTGVLIWSLHGPGTITVQGLNGNTITIKGPDPDRTLPALLVWGGVTLGPSMGYFYGNKTGRGIGGFALRNGVLIGGTLATIAICPPFGCSADSQKEDLAALVFLGSMAVVIGSSIYDIANVRKSVTKQNAKRKSKPLSVRPLISNGFRPTGLSLTLRF